MGRKKSKRTVNTDDAAEIAASLLGTSTPKHVIRKSLNAHFRGRGGISPRSFESILARARDILAARRGKSRKELRADSLEFYQSIVADPDVKPAVKVRRQEALDKLFGLQIRTILHTGTGIGGAIKTESNMTAQINLKMLSDEELMALEQLAAKVATNGGDAPA